ncbi:MAG TPA: lysophospholipid acyltransferase family protein [Tepidisphaeraceae bacterium]
MSDAFYNLTVMVCRPAFWISSSPIVLHPERVPARGAFILAPTHLSEYDVPCLMHISRRNLDFVSIVELFRKRWVGWFFSNMNAFALDRGRVDPATTRTILERLKRGRAVVMFPEGRLRKPEESVLAGGPFKTSLIRIAQLTGAPIIPSVVLGTGAYREARAWLPVRQTRFAVNFGPALHVGPGADEGETVRRLRQSWMALHDELRAEAGFRGTAADADSRLIRRTASRPPQFS